MVAEDFEEEHRRTEHEVKCEMSKYGVVIINGKYVEYAHCMKR